MVKFTVPHVSCLEDNEPSSTQPVTMEINHLHRAKNITRGSLKIVMSRLQFIYVNCLIIHSFLSYCEILLNPFYPGDSFRGNVNITSSSLTWLSVAQFRHNMFVTIHLEVVRNCFGNTLN